MDIYALLFFVIVLFMSVILVLASYYEYNLTKCKYEKARIRKEQQTLDANPYIMEPIMERETNLERQYEDSPYTLYKSYFDQPSPWIGTEYSHKSNDEEYVRSL
jgi:hypothetical protein